MRRAFFLSLALSAAPHSVFAQTAQQAPSAIAEMPSAPEILKQTACHLRDMRSYAFDFTSLMTSTADGMRGEHQTTYSASVQRPNRVSLRCVRGIQGVSAISDGKSWATYLPHWNLYTIGDAPEDPSRILAFETSDTWSRQLGMGLRTPGLTFAISPNPEVAIAPLFKSARHLGIDQLGAIRAHHIAADLDLTTLHIWISTDAPPRLIKIEAPAPTSEIDDTGYWTNHRITNTTIFSNWRTTNGFPAGEFVFTPPKDARRIENFEQEINPAAAPEENAAPMKALKVGDKAPNFKLESLDGDVVDLQQLTKQGEIVVLNFWASWCEPCCRNLPAIDTLTSLYKDAPVRIYAVNVEENVGTIQPVLDRASLKLNVLLDKDGSVAKQYGLSSIPRTVIIHDGVITFVHTQYSSTLRRTLKSEIDRLGKTKLQDDK